MADTTRLEAFLATVDGRSRRSLRTKLEANVGDPADPIRRHMFTEMLVDGGGTFADYTSAERRRGGTRITIHGPVLHRVDGAVWAPEEATPAAQQYARWLIASRPGGGAYMTELTASEREAVIESMGTGIVPGAPRGQVPPELDEYFARSWRHGGPLMAKIVARKTYAKLLLGHPVIEDFTAEPAPWFDVARKHWLRTDVPAAQRRADELAEVATWKVAHPEETAAWEARRAAKHAREAAGRVNYNELRFA